MWEIGPALEYFLAGKGGRMINCQHVGTWNRGPLEPFCGVASIFRHPNMICSYLGMDQYLLIPFLGEWTSIYQLFWCSPGVQGFDTLPSVPFLSFGILHIPWDVCNVTRGWNDPPPLAWWPHVRSWDEASFQTGIALFNPLVNAHITMENHHFLMGKLTIFNSYVKLSEGNQQPLFQRCSQLPGMFNRLYHSCGYQFWPMENKLIPILR